MMCCACLMRKIRIWERHWATWRMLLHVTTQPTIQQSLLVSKTKAAILKFRQFIWIKSNRKNLLTRLKTLWNKRGKVSNEKLCFIGRPFSHPHFFILRHNEHIFFLHTHEKTESIHTHKYIFEAGKLLIWFSFCRISL